MAKSRRSPNRTKQPYAFWIDPHQKVQLQAIKERDGVPVSEQIRRAIDRWLEMHETSRRATRRRS